MTLSITRSESTVPDTLASFFTYCTASDPLHADSNTLHNGGGQPPSGAHCLMFLNVHTLTDYKKATKTTSGLMQIGTFAVVVAAIQGTAVALHAKQAQTGGRTVYA